MIIFWDIIAKTVNKHLKRNKINFMVIKKNL